MKQERKQTHDKRRREFLQDSAAAGVGIAVAASLPGTVTAEESAGETSPKGKGYRLTNHILEYYKTISS
jgi:hypothetical protein